MNNLNVEKLTTLFNEDDRAQLADMKETEIAILNRGLDYHRKQYMEFMAQVRRASMEEEQLRPQDGHQLQSKDVHAAPVSEVSSGKTPVVPLTMPPSHRVRQDSVTSMPSGAVDCYHVARPSSLQGHQGKHPIFCPPPQTV